MYDVTVNDTTFEFECEEDAINALLLAISAIDSNLCVVKITYDIRHALKFSQYSQYKFNDYISIRKVH